jgi:SAM-dependent methyltransferase
MHRTGLRFPLIHASAEDLPIRDDAFDIVFADHGAYSFTDPHRAVPESARVLRPGGLLVFSVVSPIYFMAADLAADHATDRLVHDYFECRRLKEPDGTIDFTLPYGEWIAVFRRSGLAVEALMEPRPGRDAWSAFRDAADAAWARRWPSESIWRLRKA